jgi:hypothetical protein
MISLPPLLFFAVRQKGRGVCPFGAWTAPRVSNALCLAVSLFWNGFSGSPWEIKKKKKRFPAPIRIFALRLGNGLSRGVCLLREWSFRDAIFRSQADGLWVQDRSPGNDKSYQQLDHEIKDTKNQKSCMFANASNFAS